MSLPILKIKQEAQNTNFYRLWLDLTGNRTQIYRLSSIHFIHAIPDWLLMLIRAFYAVVAVGVENTDY